MPSFVLFIERAEALASEQRRIERPMQQAGLPLETCTRLEAALEKLRKNGGSGTRPTLVVLGPNLDGRMAMARRLHKEVPSAHFAFLTEGADPTLETQLNSPVALVGNYWRIVDIASETSSDRLQEAAILVRKQFQLSTTLDRINHQMSSYQHPEASELYRYAHSDRFRANILRHASDAIIVTDNDGVIITWNSAAEQLFGLSQDDAIGCPIREAAGGEWSEQLPRLITRVRASHAGYTRQELVCQRMDGETIFTELTLSVVRQESGNSIGISVVVRDITEHRRAEEELFRNRQRLSLAFEVAGLGVYEHAEPLDDTTYHSDRWANILGYEVAELPPPSQRREWLLERTHPDDLPGMVTGYSEFLEGQIQDYVVEVRVHHKKGEWIWVRWNYRAIERGQDGRVTRVLGVFQDMTNRKKIEDRFRPSSGATPSGILMVDDAGRITLVNSEIERYFGYTAEELIGREIEMLMPASLRDKHIGPGNELQRVPEARPTGVRRDLFGVRKDGTEFPVEVDLIPIKTENGTRVLAVVLDISERLKANGSHSMLAAIVESTHDAIITETLDGKITSWNPGAEQMFGYSESEILGQSLSFLTPPNQPNDLPQVSQAVMNGERISLYARERRRKDGTPIFVSLTISPLRNPEYEIIGTSTIARDVSEQKRAYEQITASLQEKEALIKEVHHRVKNNFQVISSLISLQTQHIKIKGKKLVDEDVTKAFAEIRNRITSIALIHERLYRSDDLSRIDFAQYVTELSASLLKSFEQSKPVHKVRIDIPNGLMGIDVAIPCGLIINELVSNSLKYAFPDGRHGEIHISLHTYGNQMTLSVTDDGVGIPETLDLHTIDSLGLRLVNTLASQIGGSMDVQRNNGTSTVITFESPHSR